MSKKMQPIEPAERAKIADLQKESAEKSNKVEWLYSGDKLDRNAYLLGKPIDKLLVEKEIEKPKEDIFSNTVDLASKIREDPLFEIKKQEIEAKKKLLENPLRIKQIKAMISKNRDSDSEDENYRDRRRDRRDERRYDRNDRDRRRRSSSSEHDSRKSKRKHEKKHKNRSSSSRSRSRDRHDSHSSSKYGLSRRDSEHKRKQISDDDEDASKSSIRKEIEETKRRIERLKQIRQTDQSSAKQTHAAQAKNVTKKMSDEEKQRRLQEMQENAKWRNEVRHTNIKRYKSDAKLEEKLEKESTSKDSQVEASHYFNTMMRDAYSSTEDRIKRNIKNVQRNQSSFDSNFARKY